MNLFYNLDDCYKRNDDKALFDYTAKSISSMDMNDRGCSDNYCLEGIISPANNVDCNSYRQCLQYFNTLPVVNCIDNVPVPYFLLIND